MDDIDQLKSKMQICEARLAAKGEALLILSRDFDRARTERDQFKEMAEQLQERYNALKRHQIKLVQNGSSMSEQKLMRSLHECRDENRIFKLEVEQLRQKIEDMDGDAKVLREEITRQRVGTADGGASSDDAWSAHERERLVGELEAAKSKVAALHLDLRQVLDERAEFTIERDAYKTKYERLSRQLLNLAPASLPPSPSAASPPAPHAAPDCLPLIDLDALQSENRYLRQRLAQLDDERQALLAQAHKYRGMLKGAPPAVASPVDAEARWTMSAFATSAGDLALAQRQPAKARAGSLQSPTARDKTSPIKRFSSPFSLRLLRPANRLRASADTAGSAPSASPTVSFALPAPTASTGDVVLSHKEVERLLHQSEPLCVSEETVNELRMLACSLLDSLQDKSVALKHQRRANKLLGQRVTELEAHLGRLQPQLVAAAVASRSRRLDNAADDTDSDQCSVEQSELARGTADESPSTPSTPLSAEPGGRFAACAGRRRVCAH